MRYQDWPTRLADFLQAASGRPFVWGTWDCCQFVGAGIAAQTGRNPVATWRGRCTTAIGARRILCRHFGGGLEAGWARLLGDPLPAPLLAQRGDVAVVRLGLTSGWDEASGIVDLTGQAVGCLGPSGIARVPLSRAVAAWRV